jgi:hypothetical protein
MAMTSSNDRTVDLSQWTRSAVQDNAPSPHRAAWRRDAAALTGVLLLWLAVWLPRLHGPIDLRWDASTYLVLGTSLAEGKGYRLLNEPGQIEAVQYPPLLPALVAVHQLALGTSDWQTVAGRLRLTYFLLSGAYLVAAYALVRTRLEPAWALAAIAGTALSFYSFLYPSDALYAEIPFALAATLFLLCLYRSEQPRWSAAAGLLASIGFLLRTAGLGLLALWVIDAVIRRRPVAVAARLAVAALPVLGWYGYVAGVTGSPAYRSPAYPYQRAAYAYANVSYAENSRLANPWRPELGTTSPRDLAGRVARNVAAIPRSLGESMWVALNSGPYALEKVTRRLGLPSAPRPAALTATGVVLWLTGVGALVGITLLLRAGDRLIPLYVGITLVMICLTPWPDQFWRYLAPLTPLSYLGLVVALRAGTRATLGKRWPSRAGALAATGLALLLLVQGIVAAGFLRGLQPVSYYHPDGTERQVRQLTYERVWHALDPAFEFIRRHSAPTDVVATAVPQLAYLRTGRPAVLIPLEADVDRAARYLDAVPATYLVLDELGTPDISARYAAPVIARSPAGWRLAFTTPGSGVRVYHRVR